MAVSILAHLERWALRCPDVGVHVALGPVFRFNPRPPRKVGAIVSSCNWREKVSILPTSKGGRYFSPVVCRVIGESVSILAHLERWALRQFITI